MEKQKTAIPHYPDINGFLASLGLEHRTENPLFYCMRLEEHKGEIYKPPFRRSFYFLGFFTEAGRSKVTHGSTNETDLNSYMVFQSPELLYSFFRDKAMRGYVCYFQPGCFSFFKPDFHKEFPFFDLNPGTVFKTQTVMGIPKDLPAGVDKSGYFKLSAAAKAAAPAWAEEDIFVV